MATGRDALTDGLPKAAKGKRPQFFEDPAIDALVSMMTELARETWVTRARLAALEHAAGAVDLESVVLPPETEAALAAQRQAFVERLFRVLDTSI